MLTSTRGSKTAPCGLREPNCPHPTSLPCWMNWLIIKEKTTHCLLVLQHMEKSTSKTTSHLLLMKKSLTFLSNVILNQHLSCLVKTSLVGGLSGVEFGWYSCWLSWAMELWSLFFALEGVRSTSLGSWSVTWLWLTFLWEFIWDFLLLWMPLHSESFESMQLHGKLRGHVSWQDFWEYFLVSYPSTLSP